MVKLTSSLDVAWTAPVLDTADGPLGPDKDGVEPGALDSAGQIHVKSFARSYLTLTRFTPDGTPIHDVALASGALFTKLSPDEKSST